VQVQRLDDGGEIVRVAIHVIARRCLARTAVTAPVVGDDAKVVLCGEEHLPSHASAFSGHP
jgi:hypothetical protein